MTRARNELAHPENGGLRDFLGINPLHIYIHGESKSPLQYNFMKGLVGPVIENDGKLYPNVVLQVNTIFFPVNRLQEVRGMWDFRREFKKGVSGVAITDINEKPSGDLTRFTWETLGNAFTQYGLVAYGDKTSGKLHGVYVISMEGAHSYIDFDSLGDESGFKEVAGRLEHLAGGKKASNYERDFTMPLELWQKTTIPDAVVRAGAALREFDLLPNIELEEYVSAKRANEIRLFLEVSGLTIGNISAWDPLINSMQITGSGLDKGNMTRSDVLAIPRFNESFDGTIAWLPISAASTVDKFLKLVGVDNPKAIKQSVEAFDQVLAYLASLLVASGDLPKPDMEKVLNLVANPFFINQLLTSHQPLLRSMVHIHRQPVEVKKGVANVVNVNTKYVNRGTHHSSCGTRPLAIYSCEALIRSLLTEPEVPMHIGVLPNHGVQIASRLPLDETIALLNPNAENANFGAVASV
ncbi:hypothetical protein HYW87_02575 [Candidatus Roizmanbacteria bacterium]|nr:hypothetical protein [Candidatus Roizmanbacteria bacterium]